MVADGNWPNAVGDGVNPNNGVGVVVVFGKMIVRVGDADGSIVEVIRIGVLVVGIELVGTSVIVRVGMRVIVAVGRRGVEVLVGGGTGVDVLVGGGITVEVLVAGGTGVNVLVGESVKMGSITVATIVSGSSI